MADLSRREPAGRGGLLQEVVRARQREPGDRRRRRRQAGPAPRWRSGSPTCRRASRSIRSRRARSCCARRSGSCSRTRSSCRGSTSTWITPPAFAPGDAALDAVAGVLAGGKNSRLYKRLVYELQVAQDVTAFQDSQGLASTFQVIVTARAGHGLEEIRRLVDEEIAKLQAAPPSERETERFQNRTEASFFDRLESVGGFGGKADQLNTLLLPHRQPRLLRGGPGALPRARPERRAGRGRPLPRPGPRGALGGAGRQEGAGRAGGGRSERPPRRAARSRSPRGRLAAVAAPGPGRPQPAARSPGRCAAQAAARRAARALERRARAARRHARGAGGRGDPGASAPAPRPTPPAARASPR